MVMSGPMFDTKVRRARADINDALGMAPQVPQPMTLPPAGLPPQGMMRQPAMVRPLPVPLQGPYPAGRLPMATPSRAVSPLGLPPQNGALAAPSIQQAQQQTAAPRPFMVGGHVEAPDPGPMALSNMSAQQLRRYYGGNYPTDNGPISMAGGGMAVRPTRRPNPYEAEILATDWAKGYQKKYGEKPDVSDASNYDYETAWRLGVRPKMTKHDDIPHWSSRASDGTMLKKPGHPTAWKEEYMQATGKDPDDVGVTEEQFKAKPRRFAAGGNTSKVKRVYGVEERKPYDSEKAYFKANPNVGGMAAEDGRIVINPFSKLKAHELDAVRLNEAARLYMRKGSPPVFSLTPEQEKFLNSTTYKTAADADRKSTIAARILSSDPSAGTPTSEQLEYVRGLKNTMGLSPKPFAAGGGAWTRKEGKNPEGGLNAKGRASLKAQGHDIKPPVSAKLAAKSPKAAARRKSFCARMSGMPGPMKDEKGRPTRKALSLRKWDC